MMKFLSVGSPNPNLFLLIKLGSFKLKYVFKIGPPQAVFDIWVEESSGFQASELESILEISLLLYDILRTAKAKKKPDNSDTN